MRLDKYLANSGTGSRSEIRKILAKGLVCVNGLVVKDGALKINETDRVEYNGCDIISREHLYFKIDKPECVLTAMEDPRLSCIGDYIPAGLKNRRLSPVGRLDYHTTGLLIITNDGDLSHRLTSPRYKVDKCYLVSYEGEKLTEEHVRLFAQGITLDDTDEEIRLKPAKLELTGDNSCVLTISEGKTHQVRRMIAKFGRSVTGLRRLKIGKLDLEGTASGVLTELSEQEIDYLKTLTGLN